VQRPLGGHATRASNLAVPIPLSCLPQLGGAFHFLGRLSFWSPTASSRSESKQAVAKQGQHGGLLLTLLFVLTVGGYLYYNLTFVQHQGRYLFPALIPIGLAFAIGWWQVMDRIKDVTARLLARSTRDFAPWLDQAQLIGFALIFIYLARLDLVALQRYIIPNLSA